HRGDQTGGNGMVASATGRLALMAIHPCYADGILEGRKQVEFRKRPLAADVKIVVIYSTAPIQRIVGAFTISETVIGSPDEIWQKFGDVGLIERSKYEAYYADSQRAVALVVERVFPVEGGLPLKALNPSPTAPQSFSYLSHSQASTLCRYISGAEVQQTLFDDVALCAVR
ncbi:hypothetical protein, partial [Pseudonocardia sp.]|uniref:hypothetical protein n=1 Tax=Pseudonocardia sp. TaxID=60912 RepID=UPI002603A9FC